MTIRQIPLRLFSISFLLIVSLYAMIIEFNHELKEREKKMFNKFLWKKAWIYIKTYWYIPFTLILVFILYFVFRKGDAAEKILEEVKNSYRKQIKVIDKIEKEEREKKEKEIEKYNDLLVKIEENYFKQRLEFDEKKKKRIKKLVKDYSGKELTEKISKEFGLLYIDNE